MPIGSDEYEFETITVKCLKSRTVITKNIQITHGPEYQSYLNPNPVINTDYGGQGYSDSNKVPGTNGINDYQLIINYPCLLILKLKI